MRPWQPAWTSGRRSLLASFVGGSPLGGALGYSLVPDAADPLSATPTRRPMSPCGAAARNESFSQSSVALARADTASSCASRRSRLNPFARQPMSHPPSGCFTSGLSRTCTPWSMTPREAVVAPGTARRTAARRRARRGRPRRTRGASRSRADRGPPRRGPARSSVSAQTAGLAAVADERLRGPDPVHDRLAREDGGRQHFARLGDLGVGGCADLVGQRHAAVRGSRHHPRPGPQRLEQPLDAEDLGVRVGCCGSTASSITAAYRSDRSTVQPAP